MQPDGSSDKLYLRARARANIGVYAARQRRRTSAFTRHLDFTCFQAFAISSSTSAWHGSSSAHQHAKSLAPQLASHLLLKIRGHKVFPISRYRILARRHGHVAADLRSRLQVRHDLE